MPWTNNHAHTRTPLPPPHARRHTPSPPCRSGPPSWPQACSSQPAQPRPRPPAHADVVSATTGDGASATLPTPPRPPRRRMWRVLATIPGVGDSTPHRCVSQRGHAGGSHTYRHKRLDLVQHDGQVAKLHQRLGLGERQRTQAGSKPAHQDQCLHRHGSECAEITGVVWGGGARQGAACV